MAVAVLLLGLLESGGDWLGRGALLWSLKKVLLVLLRKWLQSWLDKRQHDGLRCLLTWLHSMLHRLSRCYSLLLLQRPVLRSDALLLNSILL